MVKLLVVDDFSVTREDIERMREMLDRQPVTDDISFHYPCLTGECNGAWRSFCEHTQKFFNGDEEMGTTQRNIRKIMPRPFLMVGQVVKMMGGKVRGKKWGKQEYDSAISYDGFRGMPRFSLTLPPVPVNCFRTPEERARKLAGRQAKRLRISTRGYN